MSVRLLPLLIEAQLIFLLDWKQNLFDAKQLLTATLYSRNVLTREKVSTSVEIEIFPEFILMVPKVIILPPAVGNKAVACGR